MLTYHNVVFVLEYLRVAGVSQKTQDRVLSLLWKEAQHQAAANGEPTRREGKEMLS
jgi:hypothetical protein